MKRDYLLHKDAYGLRLEKSRTGRLKDAVMRAIQSGFWTFVAFVLLTGIDLLFEPPDNAQAWFTVLGLALGISLLSGLTFGTLKLLSHAQWKIHRRTHTASWSIKGAWGAPIEGEIPLKEIDRLHVDIADHFWKAHRLILIFKDGSIDILASKWGDDRELHALLEEIEPYIHRS